MTFAEFMKTVDREFHARLFMKTGWGCHQVWQAWVEAKGAALLQYCPEFTPEEFVLDAAAREQQYQLQEKLLSEFDEETKKDGQNQ